MDARKLYARINPLLKPLGPPYAALMRVRRGLYARGLLPAHLPACPCIAVGNIAFGGTGKSPVVGWLLEKAAQSGKRAVVLSRGYGARPGPRPLRVSFDTPVELAGDEALMLARRYPMARVVVHPDRAAAARLAELELCPDWLVMDDGMQHLALGRYLNLVLLRPEDLRQDWGRVIPSGPWREGPQALGSASAFLLRCHESLWPSLLPDLEKRLHVFARPIFSFSLEATGLLPLLSFGSEAAAPAFADPYLLMSGVARPDDVEQSAAKLMGRAPLHHFVFGDHHPYGPADAHAVDALFPSRLPLLCTAKDAVKLAAMAGAFGERQLWVMEAGARFGPYTGCDLPFSGWLEGRLAAFGEAGHNSDKGCKTD